MAHLVTLRPPARGRRRAKLRLAASRRHSRPFAARGGCRRWGVVGLYCQRRVVAHWVVVRRRRLLVGLYCQWRVVVRWMVARRRRLLVGLYCQWRYCCLRLRFVLVRQVGFRILYLLDLSFHTLSLFLQVSRVRQLLILCYRRDLSASIAISLSISFRLRPLVITGGGALAPPPGGVVLPAAGGGPPGGGGVPGNRSADCRKASSSV